MNQHSSPLLRLPPEIRNRIYKHIFQGHIQAYAGYYANWNTQWQSKFKFLRTCLQIRSEATLFFYSTTTFNFELLIHIENFVYRIWDHRLWAIRSIRLYAHSVMNFVDPETADSVFWIRIFPGLEELHIQGSVDQAKRLELKALRLRLDGRIVEIVFEDD
jgi:hypothetical protein